VVVRHLLSREAVMILVAEKPLVFSRRERRGPTRGGGPGYLNWTVFGVRIIGVWGNSGLLEGKGAVTGEARLRHSGFGGRVVVGGVGAVVAFVGFACGVGRREYGLLVGG